MWVCWALENETLPAFQHLLHSTGKNTLFDSHNHLPRPFGWEPTVRAFAGVRLPRTIPTRLVSTGYYALC